MTVGAEESSATAIRLTSGGIVATWTFFLSSGLLSVYVCIPAVNAFSNGVLEFLLFYKVKISGTPFVIVYIIVLISAYCGIASRDGDNKDAIVKSRWVAVGLLVAFTAAYALTVHQAVWVFVVGMLLLPTVGVFLIPEHAISPWTIFIAAGTVFSAFITLGYSIFGFSETVLPTYLPDFIFGGRLTVFIIAITWLSISAITKTIHKFRESGLRKGSNSLESSNLISRAVFAVGDGIAYFVHALPGWLSTFWGVLKSEVSNLVDVRIWGRLWKFLLLLIIILYTASWFPIARDSLVQHLRTDYFVEEYSLFPIFSLVVYILVGVFVAVGCRVLLDVKSEVRKDFGRRIGDPISALVLVTFVIGFIESLLVHYSHLEIMGYAGVPVVTTIFGIIMLVLTIKRFIVSSRRYRKIPSQ